MSVFQELASSARVRGSDATAADGRYLIFVCMPAPCGSYMLCFVQHGCLTVKAAVSAWLGVQYVEQQQACLLCLPVQHLLCMWFLKILNF